MNYEKKIRTRLAMSVCFVILGAIMMAVLFNAGSDGFLSVFSVVLVVSGAARIRKYLLILKNKDLLIKMETKETDERNVMLVDKARSIAFFAYIILSCVGIMFFHATGRAQQANIISSMLCIMLVIYWLSYFVLRKKY
ncbi:MAG: hypothetical protein IJC39_00905 [Firmicutes bacterium]|nr:hypothetical protein [Bacillota bacterium]